MPSVWSEEIVNQLKAYAEQGLSASQAAAMFDGMTRNAAVGLAHRKKFQFRGTCWSSGSRRQRKSAARSVAAPRPKSACVEVPIHFEPEPTPADNVTLDALQSWMCKFPIGDPITPEFRYCGAHRLDGRPYCGHHCRMTYETMEDRRARVQPR